MSFKSILTGAALLGAVLPVMADTGMNFFFSKNSFSTISGTKGNEIAHSSGITITNNDGVELYTSNSPGGGTPCAAFGGTTRKSCLDHGVLENSVCISSTSKQDSCFAATNNRDSHVEVLMHRRHYYTQLSVRPIWPY